MEVVEPLGRRLRGWCSRPALAGALAGLPGGVAFVLVSTALITFAVRDGGTLLTAAGPRWLVRLALGILLGAAFGRLVGARLVGARLVGARLVGARLAGVLRAAVLGAAFGLVWWVLEAFALAPFRPEICALVGEIGRGDLETSPGGLVCYLAYGVITGAAFCGCRAVASQALPAVRRLEVYVAAHCLSCVEARRLAAAAARRFPSLDVRTIDVEAATPAGTPTPLPERVVAVPTYLLDGAVIALGNPDPEQLFARIASPPSQSASRGRRRG
jgi:ABC-type amino acid transport substrate-binding protein